MNLGDVRSVLLNHLASLRDRDGPVGSYRGGRGRRTDLYASLDVALMRTLMGETLAETLSPAERLAWADHIEGPAYAIDDDTAIQVVDGEVTVVSEGDWKLLKS